MKTYPVKMNRTVPVQRRQKKSNFTRTAGIAMVLVVCGALVVSAGVLQWFGQINMTVAVEPTIEISGDGGETWQPWDEALMFGIPEPAPGGERFCYKFMVRNQGSQPIDIDFITECIQGDMDGIEVKQFMLPEERTLILENKDAVTWQPIVDDMQGVFDYTVVGNELDYEFTGTGLASETDYCLIYYADFDPRFDLWGGNNPGALIGTFTTDINGDVVTGPMNIELNMNLPEMPDWNIYPDPNYEDFNNGFDDYEHGECGAKIWCVPAADYDDMEKKVINWNPEAFLMETDLMTYYDCDFTMSHCHPGSEYEIVDGLQVDSEEEMWLLICYSFDDNIYPGTYELVTSIVLYE